ncbi:toll/interleukin-1 receptor domain-containing protein [Variovorax rhizosphaerae]|uniref:TIR domain-containing protein n=1 Tax=Variovorax rhizosphaerae TaxID=1836200 RepID=A0ABU8WHM3_9BURK
MASHFAGDRRSLAECPTLTTLPVSEADRLADSDTGNARARPRVFISYSRKDTPFARGLFDSLGEQGVDAWVDWEGIPPSAEWWREVQAAIDAAEAFVFVMSPDSLGSAVCRDEVAHAVQNNKRLIPLVARQPDENVLAGMAGDPVWAAVGRINWIYFRDSDDVAAALAKLVEAIRTDLDWVRSHSRLLLRAIEWDTGKRDASFLLQDNDLNAAQAWLEKGPERDPKPTSLQTEYILTSRTTEVQRRRRLRTGIGIAALLIVIAGLVAIWQTATSSLREAEGSSRRLAAQVPAAFDNDAWDLGLLLGTLAVDTGPTVEAVHALLGGLDRMRGVRSILPGRFAVDGPFRLSADGRLLAVTACDPADTAECSGVRLAIIDTARSVEIASYAGPLEAIDAAFDDAGKRLAVSSCCAAAGAFEQSIGRPEEADRAEDHWSRIQVLDLPPASVGLNQPLLLQRATRQIDAPGGEIRDLAFIGGNRLAGRNRAILDWRLEDGSVAKTVALRADAVDHRFSKALAVKIGISDGTGVAALWQLTDRARPLRSIPYGNGTLQQVAFSPDGRMGALLTCAIGASGRHCDGELRLLDLDAGRVRGAVVTDTKVLDPMLSVAFTQDSQWLVTGGCAQNTATEACLHGRLSFWSLHEEDMEATVAPVRAFGGTVERVTTSRTDHTLASISSRGKVTVWNVDSETLTSTNALASPLQIRRTAVPHAPLVCGQTEWTDAVLRDAAVGLKQPGELCPAMQGFAGGWPLAFDWDAHDRRLAVGGCVRADKEVCERGMVRVWAASDGKLKQQSEHPVAGVVTGIALGRSQAAQDKGPPGNMMAIARCNRNGFAACLDAAAVEIVDLGGSSSVREVATGLSRVTALALDPRAQVLAYATCIEFPDAGPPTDQCAAGATRLVALSTGEMLDGELTGHRGAVTALAFNPDATLLASGDMEGNIAFWDVASRQPMGPLVPTHYEPVESLRFTSDTVLSSQTASAAFEWRAAPQAWKEAACGLARRPLTDSERQRWAAGKDSTGDPCAEAAGSRRSGWSRWMRALVLRYEGRG